MAPAAAELAARLGLPFADLNLLRQALIHSSHTNEHPAAGQSNERLEFLGDAVLSLVVSEVLWQRYPGEDEGSLTTRRAAIVSAAPLAAIARRLDLGSYLLLGQGADAAGERTRKSVLAGTFEAVVGAIYLELGIDHTRRWLLDVVRPEIDAVQAVATLKPPKSALQEFSYATTGRPPHYRVLSEEGPAHNRRYVVEAIVGDRPVGRGEGRNRREAETAAAVEALNDPAVSAVE
jgi:ribonuclease III